MVEVPWSALSRLKEDIERSLGECLGRGTAGRQPLWDLLERPQEYVLLAEMAAVVPESIDVRVAGNTLTVKAERVQELPEPGEVYHVAERSYGPLTRSLNLPGGVDASLVRAEYRHGLLRVRLPKSPEAEARKIKVEGVEGGEL